MGNYICNYSIIRFQPYRDTGEFVNIGVVVYCPELDVFDFVLEQKRRRRINGFFPELDRVVLKEALRCTGIELGAHRSHRFDLKPQDGVENRLNTFKRIVAMRDSLIQFSPPGFMFHHDPHAATKELFDRFVHRLFATKPHGELQLKNRLRNYLVQWDVLKRFETNQRIGNEDYSVRIPFVELREHVPIRALNPIDLDREEKKDIIETGIQWIGRADRLNKMRLMPEKFVFPVQLPTERGRLRVANDVLGELNEIPNVCAIPFDETQRLKSVTVGG